MTGVVQDDADLVTDADADGRRGNLRRRQRRSRGRLLELVVPSDVADDVRLLAVGELVVAVVHVEVEGLLRALRGPGLDRRGLDLALLRERHHLAQLLQVADVGADDADGALRDRR